MSGGKATRSKTNRQAVRSTSRQHGGVTTVEADPFEGEAEEFGRVYAIMRERGGFGRSNTDPPFYVPFDTRERHTDSYGARCRNCGEESHFARERPAKCINRSALIHPAVGDGTPEEAENCWRRWEHKLCKWAQARANRNNRNSWKGKGRSAHLPVALRSFLPLPNNAGRASTGNVAGGRRPTATYRSSSVGSASNVAVQDQEAGCNLSVIGKIGGYVFFLHLGRHGSNYPGSR